MRTWLFGVLFGVFEDFEDFVERTLVKEDAGVSFASFGSQTTTQQLATRAAAKPWFFRKVPEKTGGTPLARFCMYLGAPLVVWSVVWCV